MMWNILIFGVIPALSVAILFFIKRKILWIAPLVSTALAFIAYTVAFAPTSIVEVFGNNEWRGFFLLAMLMHIAVVVVLTVIAYIIAFILKRKNTDTTPNASGKQ